MKNYITKKNIGITIIVLALVSAFGLQQYQIRNIEFKDIKFGTPKIIPATATTSAITVPTESQVTFVRSVYQAGQIINQELSNLAK